MMMDSESSKQEHYFWVQVEGEIFGQQTPEYGTKGEET